MLRVIEETVPVQRIWLDTAENKEAPLTGFSGESSEAILDILKTLYQNMVQIKGISPEEAKISLRTTEPFNKYPDLISTL